MIPDSLVLAIDTATPMQSLALVRGARVIFEAFVPSQTHDGPGLLSLLDRALQQSACTLKDIDRLAVSRGPGAFTGLRVSMAMLKSLALTLDKPLYAASSLDAIAEHALPCSAPVFAACIDARRGELYVAFYHGQTGERLSDEMLCKPADFVAYVDSAFPDQTIECVGPAFPNYTQKLGALCSRLILRPENIHASALAKIVLQKFPDSPPDIPLEALEPRYIRMDDFELPKPFDFSQPGQFRRDH